MPRGQRARLDSDIRARIDRSTCLVEPSCSKISHSFFPHVWHHLLGCLSRLFFVNLGPVLCLHFCLHFGFVRPALEVRTETDLHLLGLLILLSVSSWIIGTCLCMLLETICISSWIIRTWHHILLRTLATSSMSCT